MSAFKNLCINLYHMDWNALGHAALDVAGVFFEGADVINAIWYACEGNMEMAAASAISALPGIGMASKGLLMKGNKVAAAERAVRAIAQLTQGTIGVCVGIETAQTGFTNFLNGLEAGTFDGGALLQTLGGIGLAVLSGKSMVPSGRELLACTGNPAKTMKGRLLDADISGKPVESSDAVSLLLKAEKARDDLIINTPGGTRKSMVIGAYDIKTGDVVADFAGPIPEKISPVLIERADKIGGIGSMGLTDRNTIGVCAEFRSANQLLLNGSDISNIKFTKPIRPRTGEIRPNCNNCIEMFSDIL